MESAVHIEHLQIRLNKHLILPDLTLDIPAGKIVGLLGPSGAGKTTLVKAVIGMHAASAGKVKVFGQHVPSLKILPQVGYMAQEDALYEDLTALDNILFFGKLFGVRGAHALERARTLLDFVGLSGDEKKVVANLSGGMKRRLTLAITLMHEPRLLILDEPTVGIDPLLRKRFWDRFTELRDGGTTVFVTTHVMDEARHCDLILLMREGRLIAQGTLDELLHETGATNMEDAFLAYCGSDQEAI